MSSSTTAFIKRLLADNAPKLIDELTGSREYISPLKSAVDASDSLAPTVVSGGLGDGITKAAESAFKGLSNSTYRTPILNATALNTGDDASRRQLFGASVALQKSAVDSGVSTGGTFERNQSPAEVTPSGATQPQAVALAAHAANRLIVKFKDGVASAQINQYKDLFGAVTTKTIPLTGAQIWTLSGKLSVEQILAQYKSNSAFAYVEPDYIVTAGSVSSKAIPNDPSFNVLWGLNNTGQSGGTVDADIDAPEAWDIQTGNPNLVIGVIDTGVDYNHPDLTNNIWVNSGEIAGDGIDNDGNGYVDDVRGWDFAYGDNDPMDVYGHGTHVSGTIAAKGNNATGVTGVAWNAKIMPLKFLDDDGFGSTSDAILAVDYATTKGVKITNNSWGGGGYSTALYDAINAAGSAGCIVYCCGWQLLARC